MKTVLVMIQIFLSLLLLEAHFMFHSDMPMLAAYGIVVIIFALSILCSLMSEPWARRYLKISRRVLQVALLLGLAEWVLTMIGGVMTRIDAGDPWLRYAMILTPVALWTGASVLLLELGRMKTMFGNNAQKSPQSQIEPDQN